MSDSISMKFPEEAKHTLNLASAIQEFHSHIRPCSKVLVAPLSEVTETLVSFEKIVHRERWEVEQRLPGSGDRNGERLHMDYRGDKMSLNWIVVTIAQSYKHIHPLHFKILIILYFNYILI